MAISMMRAKSRSTTENKRACLSTQQTIIHMYVCIYVCVYCIYTHACICKMTDFKIISKDLLLSLDNSNRKSILSNIASRSNVTSTKRFVTNNKVYVSYAQRGAFLHYRIR